MSVQTIFDPNTDKIYPRFINVSGVSVNANNVVYTPSTYNPSTNCQTAITYNSNLLGTLNATNVAFTPSSDINPDFDNVQRAIVQVYNNCLPMAFNFVMTDSIGLPDTYIPITFANESINISKLSNNLGTKSLFCTYTIDVGMNDNTEEAFYVYNEMDYVVSSISHSNYMLNGHNDEMNGGTSYLADTSPLHDGSGSISFTRKVNTFLTGFDGHLDFFINIKGVLGGSSIVNLGMNVLFFIA